MKHLAAFVVALVGMVFIVNLLIETWHDWRGTTAKVWLV